MGQQSVESIRAVVSSKLNAVDNWSLILQGTWEAVQKTLQSCPTQGVKELGCLYCHQLPPGLLAKVESSCWRKLSGKLSCEVKGGPMWMEIMS